MKKLSIRLTDVALLALSLVFALSLATVFQPCGPKDDGSWMRCHWAGLSVLGVGAVFVLLSVARLFIPSPKVKAGISVAFVPFSLLAAIIPGILIPLCSMKDMRCQAVTRPAAVVLSLLVAALAAVDLFVQLKSGKD